MTRTIWKENELNPPAQFRCYPKAEIRQGADCIRARPAVGATPRRVRPGHDAQGCWARHDQLTNATLAAEFGTQNCYLAMAAMRTDRRGTSFRRLELAMHAGQTSNPRPLGPASVGPFFLEPILAPRIVLLRRNVKKA